MKGKFKSSNGESGTIVIVKDDGKEVTVSLAATVEVTLNGEVTTISKLAPGDRVETSGSPVTEIIATR